MALDDRQPGPEGGLVECGGNLADAAADNRSSGEAAVTVIDDAETSDEAILLGNQPDAIGIGKYAVRRD